MARPLLSGFCNPSNNQQSHRRCRLGGCSCTCHAPTGPITPTGVLVTAAEPGTDEWFAVRRAGITGTDLPKILGLTQYGNALSVWLDKRGELDDDAGEAARWGQLLEDVVAREWAHRHDTDVVDVGVLAHHEHDWQRASLDRLVVTCPDGQGPCALEVKTRSAWVADQWADGVPDSVLAQTAWGLIVTGLEHHHVAALIGGQRLVSYRVDRDPKLEDYLLDAARPVWQAVLDGVPPEVHPDADGVLLQLLDRLYASRDGEREVDPGRAGEWLATYADGSELEKRGKALKTEAKTALVQMLDDGDTGVVGGAPVFTYKRPSPGVTVPAAELKRLATEQPDTYSALLAEGYITPTDPGPRFTVKAGSKNGDAA